MGNWAYLYQNGKLMFNPRLLRKEEFLKKQRHSHILNINKDIEEIELEKGSICFTYCQIPIIYKLAGKDGMKVIIMIIQFLNMTDLNLDLETSKKVFERTGEIKQIIVSIKQINY